MTTIYFPWATFTEPLELSIVRGRIDGNDPGRDLVDLDYRQMSLYLLEREWESVELEVALITPADQMTRFEDGGSIKVGVLAFGAKTNTRQTSFLEQSATDPSRWLGSLTLDRQAFRGKCRLTGIVSGTVDGVAGRYLGEAPPWALYFDEPEVPPIEGMLRVRWAWFKGPDRSPRIPEMAENESFYVAVQEEPPAVYLSKNFPGLGGLLSEGGRRPPGERALRDAEYRRIASAAWSEMLATALGGVEPADDDDPSWPDEDWKRDVLQSMLGHIYPEASEDNERLKLAVEQFRGEGSAQFQALAQIAINKEIGAARSLAAGIAQVNAS